MIKTHPFLTTINIKSLKFSSLGIEKHDFYYDLYVKYKFISKNKRGKLFSVKEY